MMIAIVQKFAGRALLWGLFIASMGIPFVATGVSL
jgi:hypothetical protein